MLELVMAFAAGVVLSAMVGILEKRRFIRAVDSFMDMVGHVVREAKKQKERDAAQIKALKAEIQELTAVSK